LQYHPFPRVEGGEELVHHPAAIAIRSDRVVGRAARHDRLDEFHVGVAQVGEAHFRAGFLFAEVVVAGVQCDAGHPVGKRLDAAEAIDAGEHFHEHLLHQVLLIRTAGKMVAHNPQDVTVQGPDQPAGRHIVSMFRLFDDRIPIGVMF